jgi:hypothetical protein
VTKAMPHIYLEQAWNRIPYQKVSKRMKNINKDLPV